MKKKILYYSDCFFFAGCENMIANFLNSQDLNNEFDVHFVYRKTARYEEGAKARINDMCNCEGVNIIIEPDPAQYVTSSIKYFRFFQKIYWASVYLLVKYWALYKNIRTLIKVFSKYNPDIVHVNNGGYPAANSAQAAVFAAHNIGVQNIYYVVNNMAVGYSHPFRWFDIFVDLYVKKFVTKFITGSHNAGNHLKKTLKLPLHQQVTLRNGINLRTTTMSVGDFCMTYEIPTDRLVFTTIANLEERKGHRFLLDAIKELRNEDKLQNCVFVFEGKGIMELYIKEYISHHHLEDYVKLISVGAIYDLYSVTDVTILPSIANEDFPNIIIESMGMGIPVIGTRIAGIPEQIVDNETGLLIEPANVDQLKSAILQMIHNSDFRGSCGRKAREFFVEKYTAKKSVEKYIELYKG